MKLVLASGNAGKLVELERLLADTGIELLGQRTLGVDDIEETATTFIENALLKARHAARVSGLASLADDSGLCVDALGGAPGLRSARYAGGNGGSAANNAKLLTELAGVPDEQRTARFYCVLVLLRHADDSQPLIAEGSWPGHILNAPRGTGGFGYDPVFLDPVSGLSAAELEPAFKNRVSHRGQALEALRARIATLQPAPPAAH